MTARGVAGSGVIAVVGDDLKRVGLRLLHELRRTIDVVPAKAGIHFAFSPASQKQNQDGFPLSRE
jgi:hypothetical protein